MDNPLISEEVARKITGGRKPLVPIQYESAVKALVECTNLDDAKIWSDKADALAAWAKIYRDDEVGIEARKLKLHAYRRMGVLAHELYPGARKEKDGRHVYGAPHKGQIGHHKGPIAALQSAGLKMHQANVASAIAKIPDQKFKEISERPRPPSPSALMPKIKGATDMWKKLAGQTGGNSLLGFRGVVRSLDARMAANALSESEAKLAKEAAREVAEWIDEFDRFLSKRV
jgi:hypothetical protein